MGVETLTKRSDAQKVEGKRRRGRLSMRMKDCDKGNLERVGGEWGTTARDRQSWRLVIENVVREKLGEKRRRKGNSNPGYPHS